MSKIFDMLLKCTTWNMDEYFKLWWTLDLFHHYEHDVQLREI